MKFFSAVLRVSVSRPDRVLSALYWYITGKKVRARNRLRLAIAQGRSAYSAWMSNIERLDETVASAADVIANWRSHPSFTVLVLACSGHDAASVTATLRSVVGQIYPACEVLVASGNIKLERLAGEACGATPWRLIHAANAADALGHICATAKGEYIVTVRAGDRLSWQALYRYAQALQDGRSDILYGDEDDLGRGGRRSNPWFKPDWNSEMFLAQDYVSRACALQIETLRDSLPLPIDLAPVAIFAVLLKAAVPGGYTVKHVPHILCHCVRGGAASELPLRVAAVSRHLASRGASVGTGMMQTVRVRWPLPGKLPKVSIIIPTRDRLRLIRACIDSITALTDYANLEIIVVDNESSDPLTLEYFDGLEDRGVAKVLKYEGTFNYSAINNCAVDHAAGEFLCLLNNDTEVLTAQWLKAMMRQAVRPHVGAVGARLLYSDGSIQHAGVVIGLGQAAGHAHRYLPKGDSGYFNYPYLPQYVSAVTGACLVVAKSKFEAVGGLDAEALAVAFNDVDLCLKLQAAGWRNVYEPDAVLVHHESKSRGSDVSPENIERYHRELDVLQTRWGTKTYQDPLHNINLDPAFETFRIKIS